MERIQIDRIRVGMLENNVYYLSDGDGTHGLLVDPGCRAERIVSWLGDRKVDAILLTHCHFDHVGAAAELREHTHAPVYASAPDAPYIEGDEPTPEGHRRFRFCTVDAKLSDGDELPWGDMSAKVLHTPGHTRGGLCFLLGAPHVSVEPAFPVRAAALAGVEAFGSVLISGDTLFEGTYGRTDFEGGSDADMRASLRRLYGLPDDTLVLPGHGEPTVIALERERTFL